MTDDNDTETQDLRKQLGGADKRPPANYSAGGTAV
jgi:hypothetical protein